MEGPLCLMVDEPTRALLCGLVSGEWRAGGEAVALIPPRTGGWKAPRESRACGAERRLGPKGEGRARVS